MTMEFEGTELELVERACRALAERARRDAEPAKGMSVERIHKELTGALPTRCEATQCSAEHARSGAAAEECAADQARMTDRPLRRRWNFTCQSGRLGGALENILLQEIYEFERK